MTDLAVDYAWQHPDPAHIAAAGYSTVLRYLSKDPSKNISPTEITALHHAGLSIGLVWETTAQRADDSNPAQNGVSDALEACRQAQQVGYPQGCVLFANCGDWAVTLAQVDSVRQYMSTWTSEVRAHGYVSGGYCTGFVIDELNPSLPLVWWQNAMDDQGVKGSTVNAHATLYQRVRPTHPIQGAAGEYDENVILRPFPTWGPATIPTRPQPAAPPRPTEPIVTHPPFPGRLLEVGVTGNDVRMWQGRMRERGWTILVDGHYGPASESVCRQFQTEKHLVVDGIVGKRTWNETWTAPVTRA